MEANQLYSVIDGVQCQKCGLVTSSPVGHKCRASRSHYAELGKNWEDWSSTINILEYFTLIREPLTLIGSPNPNPNPNPRNPNPNPNWKP